MHELIHAIPHIVPILMGEKTLEQREE